MNIINFDLLETIIYMLLRINDKRLRINKHTFISDN